MKNKLLIIFGLVFLMAFALMGANPSFNSFNTNQFGNDGTNISIKSGALQTNIPDSALSTNVPLLNAPTNTFSGSGGIVMTNTVGGNSGGLTVSGTGGNVMSIAPGGSSLIITASGGGTVTVSGGAAVTANSFSGAGTSLTALNASQLTSGTVSTNRLPSPLFNVGAGLLATTNGALVTATTNGQTPAASITGVVPIANGGTASSTGDGSGLTNLSMADGGKTLVAAGTTSSAWGSSNGMNPNAVRSVFYANGSTAGFAVGNDAANIAINESTNFNDSGGGWGIAQMGGGTGSGGANVINLVAGPTSVMMPTNRVSFLIPGFGYTVWNSDTIVDKGYGWCSPGFNDLPSLDSGNYFGWVMDGEHGFVGAPLLNANQAGVYQPDDVVYQFTVSGVTTAPTLVGNSVYLNNGHYYTAYSNNISAGSGSLMMTSAYGAPAASGTLTKVNGVGDATISFSAAASLRTWTWGIKISPSAGTLSINSNYNSTGGHFMTQAVNSGANGVNPWSTPQTITFLAANSSGLLVQDNGSVESVATGTRAHYITSGNSGSGTDLWYASPTFTVGGDELADFNNRGFSTLEAHGSFGLKYTNTAANYNVTVADGVVSLNGSGTITATLPDASSHAKGRIFIIKNTGTTNSTIATTSAQTIDGKTSTTNAPNESLIGISDGANWKIIGSFGGAPTNFFAVTTSGFTNTTPWEEVAYVTNGTAVTLTNFLSTGQAYFTNTTLLNGTMTIMLMPGDSFVAAAAAGLGGTVRALKR